MRQSFGDQFMLQQLIAVFVAWGAGVLASAALTPLGLAESVFAQLVCVWSAALLCGFLLPRFATRGLEMARWTGIAPSLIFLIVFSAHAMQFGLQFAATSFFGFDESAEEGVGIAFVTMPTFSAIGYSIGAVIGRAIAP